MSLMCSRVQEWRLQLPLPHAMSRIPDRVISGTLKQELANLGLTLQELIPKLGRPPKRAKPERGGRGEQGQGGDQK